MLDVSIIIVNWNTAKLLTQCLDSIYKTGSRYSFEVIVVDNGSKDESVTLVARLFPSVVLVQNNENLGFARANNQGLAAATGEAEDGLGQLAGRGGGSACHVERSAGYLAV